MNKRYRAPEAKSGELLAKYGKEYGDLDIFYCWPENDEGMKRDGRLVMTALEKSDVFEGKSLRQELEARGYDITTLKFSIKKRVNDG